MTCQIIQITDCHLFADRSRELRGIATWPRFCAALRAIRERFPDCDFLVVTGDTAHDEERATYEAVRRELADWADRVRIIPGNHDNRAALRSVFPESSGIVNDRVTFSVDAKAWRLIGLDSQLPGALPGRLGDEQLASLRRELGAARDRPTALFLHHPPITVGSRWLDAIRLQDADELQQLLSDFPQVRFIGCGHVHQAVTASLGAATVFTTPAVGLQFRPRTEQLEIDSSGPGFRLIELQPSGHWSTQVFCCDVA